MKLLDHILRNAKAYAAALGALTAGLLSVVDPSSAIGKALVVVAVIATGVATYRVPNASLAEHRARRAARKGGRR